MYGHSLVAQFDERGYQKLESLLSLDKPEKISHIPYGRGYDEQRYLLDTLPLHITISSSKKPLSDILRDLSGFSFDPIDVEIEKIKVGKAKAHSQILYFKIKQTKDTDSLLENVFKRMGNEKYLPGCTLHITICISKDKDKIQRIKEQIEARFKPFTLRIMSLGLYEIWPATLKSIYYTTPAPPTSFF